MVFETALILTLFSIILVAYRLLFRDKINWNKLVKSSSKKNGWIFKRFEKFQKSSLYSTVLSALNLEVEDVKHFQNISDHFESFQALSLAIQAAGLERSHLIVGIDFTASNEWQGRFSFDGKSLHAISKKSFNPYQQVICSLATTLEPFASSDGNLIPVFGFGDESTQDRSVFQLNSKQMSCRGLDELLECYEKTVEKVVLSGPTNFTPIIDKAIEKAMETNEYHILLIIADGQVEEEQEAETKDAIIHASHYPLSIILVGVGDGPWENMHDFDDKIPARQFDNFQFIEFNACTDLESGKISDINFALNALMEIPDQYKQLQDLGLVPSIDMEKTINVINQHSFDNVFLNQRNKKNKFKY